MRWGISLEVGSTMMSFIGCRSVCSVPKCDGIATKYYVRGEDPEFEEMYERSYYAKLESWIRDRVYILGFCDNHGYTETTRDENDKS